MNGRLGAQVAASILAFAGALCGQTTNVFPASGSVGIGTTSPQNDLEISGSSNMASLRLDAAGINGYVLQTTGSAGDYGLNITYNNPTSVFSNIMSFTYAGNVGIGTTTPSGQLHVLGSGSDTNLIIDVAQQASFNPMLSFREQSTAVWNIGIDTADSAKLKFAAGGNWDNLRSAALMTITGAGFVGIGTTSPVHPLHVAGTIGAEEIIVSATGADYVFQPDYHLAPLTDVSIFIQENHHLPGIASSSEMRQEGVSVGDLQLKLLAKIEELTLHMIQADERSNPLELENRELREQNRQTQARIARLEKAQPAGTKPGESQ
jgi:hypothetical protein